MARTLAGSGAIVQIDIDQSPAVAARYGIRSVPTLVLLKKGQVVDQLPGARSAAAIVEWFRKARS